jgi:hypothetical protein
MRTKTRIIAGIVLLLLNLCVAPDLFSQEKLPLVYSVENTGVDCTKPPLPSFAELPVVKPLTDPFEWSDGSGRDTTFASWERRRNEIKAELEQYEIGPKPERPDTMSATYIDDTLRVYITENGETLTLVSRVTLPAGDGPFPALIGMGGATVSQGNDFFLNKGIALVPFNFSQVMQWQQVRGTEPINRLYPDLTYFGSYAAWSWGVSRLIDGMELVAGDLPIDLAHLAVTGCSFAGKMALWAGALDERIALTIPQESGGGGVAAWRVSNTLGNVETIAATSGVWFLASMKNTFGNANVSKLPMDHHELVAMIAPRAILNIGNPSQVWLAEESGYVSSVAAKKVWENFGIADRFGYSFVTDHPHCALPAVQAPEVEAFVDKFLLGDTLANTNITTNDYGYVRPEYWFEWWGKGDPYFATLDRGESEEYWFEAECGTIGPAWNVRLDTMASNDSYAVPKPGLNSTGSAPEEIEAVLSFTFTVETDTTYYLFGRVDCPTFSNDSYWMKFDDGDFKMVTGIASDGWEWKEFATFDSIAGEHTISFAYREEGAKLDKICISTFGYPPGEKGEVAEFVCTPDTTTIPYTPPTGLNMNNSTGNFNLGQNYPNPLDQTTTIDFEIPWNTYVSLKVYSVLGEEIGELAGREYTAGRHTVEFDARDLAQGIYFYTLEADGFSASRMMILQTE